MIRPFVREVNAERRVEPVLMPIANIMPAISSFLQQNLCQFGPRREVLEFSAQCIYDFPPPG